ncbi:murein biosynthesis integral membrane protein MurJ [Candidatus Spongiihabitans sp.]|uniref:murein biosynthesis integral membrane protein MurJ n=1 Tax=Candidatus Spongiihabitans sp. TaxID=3101308 RepID=UPI003C7AF2EB
MSSKLIKSVSVVGAMTLVSRMTGLIRDVIFANILGDKAAADIFFVAFRIPNFFRRISGEGAFSAAFVPVFTDYRLNNTESDTNRFLQILIGRFGLILLVVSALGVIFAHGLVAVLAAGFVDQPEKFNLAVQATRITFPYVFFISFVAMAGGMLNTCGRFAVPAATPILLNICLIFAALVLVPMVNDSPIALSFGVLAAGLIQLLFQLPFLKKEKLTIKPRIIKRAGDEIGVAGVKRVFRLTLPAIFGVSVAQLNMIVNMVLASYLVTGSISWLYYSDRLMEFPVGVFGIALGTVLLPDLSRKHAMRAAIDFSKTLDWGLRWICLVCVPASAGLIVLAKPMVATIYYHGDFTANGVDMTAASLVAYSIGLTAIVMVKVLAPGFYARENTKTPVRIAMISMAINIVFCLLLITSLKHVGLALATTISAICNAAMLHVVLRREKVLMAEPGWPMFLLKVLSGSSIMAAALWWFMGDGGAWLEISIWSRALKLSLLLLLGAAVYFGSLFLMGIKPRNLWLAKDTNQ